MSGEQVQRALVQQAAMGLATNPAFHIADSGSYRAFCVIGFTGILRRL